MKQKQGKERRKKGSVSWEVIAWIIAILVLAFAIIMYMILSKRGFNFIDWAKNFFRFR